MAVHIAKSNSLKNLALSALQNKGKNTCCSFSNQCCLYNFNKVTCPVSLTEVEAIETNFNFNLLHCCRQHGPVPFPQPLTYSLREKQ